MASDEPPSAVSLMIDAINEDARRTADYTGQSQVSKAVLDVMAQTPRVEFVPDDMSHLAYYNVPLGIGYQQTISQPFIVALMTDLMQPAVGQRVLEIGTGSGYQAAVLSRLVDRVFTIEIVPELAARAAQTLDSLEYDNVDVRAGDGWFGWPEASPFDGIIVTAVAAEVPPALIEQLRPGGRMVMPVGDPDGSQMLVLLTKDASGVMSRRDVLPVQFVPLTRLRTPPP